MLQGSRPLPDVAGAGPVQARHLQYIAVHKVGDGMRPFPTGKPAHVPFLADHSATVIELSKNAFKR